MKDIKIIDNNIFYNEENDILIIELNNEYLSDRILKVIEEKEYKQIRFDYKGNIYFLNSMLSKIKKINNKSDMLININKTVLIGSKVLLDLDDLSDNIKLNVLPNEGIKNGEFYNWFINLNEKDFNVIKNHISPEIVKLSIIEERIVCKDFYDKLSKYYDLSLMSRRRKMDLVFDIIRNNVKYDKSMVAPDGSFRTDVDRSVVVDPVKVYRGKKGVCYGRSRLVKLLLNNSYMNVECYVAECIANGYEHEWNEFIDDDGLVYSYDLSYGLTHIYNINNTRPERYDIKHSTIVEDKIKKDTEIRKKYKIKALK